MRILLILIIAISASSSETKGQHCRCETCENPVAQRGLAWRAYWGNLRNQIGQRPAGRTARLQGSTQTVFLDFDSGNDSSIVYSVAQRDAIQAELENIYSRFNVSFTQSNPGGVFSTLFFNEGTPGGGRAEDIDFRNLNQGDNAVLNVDGLGLSDGETISVSTLIAAHELGHLLGLRHADMFGPIGEGVLPGFGFFYDPVYNGPDNAFEAEDHVMITGAFGIPFSAFVNPSWLSERSTSKLTFAEFGVTTDDTESNDSIATAQQISLQPLKAPNTIVSGVNSSNADFSISAAVVVGSLNGNLDPQDVFQIQGNSGDLFNLQVLSNVPSRLSDNPINPNLSVFDANGSFVDYYGANAFNESELKSDDCNMIDLVLPADGTYFVEVDSPFAIDVGDYELFIYRFNGIIGDLSGDGVITLLDVSPFVDAVLAGDNLPLADINCDGETNLLDVSPFIDLVLGN